MAVRTRHLALAAAALAIGAAAYFALPGSATVSAAPAVRYTLLDGSEHGLADLKGRVVLINFWATSCASCVAEMPQIVATHEQFKARGYETVAVAMSYDTPAFVSHFAESRQLPFAVVFDRSGTIAHSFGDVALTPTSYLLDKQGRIVKRYVGKPDFDALHGLIDELLRQEG
jgi:peroxiredoxin